MDLKCEMIYEEFASNRDSFVRAESVIKQAVCKALSANRLVAAVLESRVKDPESLRGKLERKGDKYSSLSDITDLIGMRIVTFYESEVDKVSALICSIFDVDWENSVDKRKILNTDQFGYTSLHYVCRIPESLYSDPEYPDINKYSFEIQIRTLLQHLWATTMHDTGYKSNVEIPRQYNRELSRLAGLIELTDECFSNLMCEITEYKRNVTEIVESGNFDDLELNGDTFRDYMATDPFRDIVSKIANINRAEINRQDADIYLPVLIRMGCRTLGDVEDIKAEYSEAAYKLASSQLGKTDIDIISSNIGLRNLCIIYCLKNPDVLPLTELYKMLGINQKHVSSMAGRTYENAKSLNIIS